MAKLYIWLLGFPTITLPDPHNSASVNNCCLFIRMNEHFELKKSNL